MKHKQKLDQLQEALARQNFQTQGELSLAHFLVSLIACMKDIVTDMEKTKQVESIEALKLKAIESLRDVEACIKARDEGE
jgi:hypothetical protein